MLREQRELHDHLVLLGRQTAVQRVAQFLLEFAKFAGSAANRVVGLPMSRQDIADYLGLSAETVCRTLSQLSSRGVIVSVNVQRVLLRDPETLERLAAGEE
jgi:CRP/FNR family nitrogen fixation transcriptional regulator